MRSITLRLVSWNTIIFSVILILCVVTAVYMNMHFLLYEDAAKETREAVETIKAILVIEATEIEHSFYNYKEKVSIASEITTALERTNIWVQVTAANGEVLSSSRRLKGLVLIPEYIGPPRLSKLGGHQVFKAGFKQANGDIVQVVRSVNREISFVNNSTKNLCLILLAGLLLSVIAGMLVTKTALKPVQQLTQTAQNVSTSDLSSRIPLTGPADELYSLTETFNQMMDRLEKGFHSQQDFLNAASHDLRTPLTVIKSYSDILNRWGKEEPEVIKEAIPAIVKAVEVMERLVNDLLLTAKMKAGVPLQISTVPFDELAVEIVQEAQSTAKDLTMYLKTLEPITAEVDEYYLRRILWIIVDNAMKYNHPGGQVAISVFKIGNGEAVFEVTDTGMGISEHDLPKIFDRFYRGDPSRTQSKGFGLGLSLAKDIVTALHGRIEVKSQPGRGSTFQIILPTHLG